MLSSTIACAPARTARAITAGASSTARGKGRSGNEANVRRASFCGARSEIRAWYRYPPVRRPGSPTVTRTTLSMRVIHVAPTPFGRSGLFGGGERYPLELARALSAHVECELVTFGPRPRTVREPSGLTIRTLRVVGYMSKHPAHPIAPALPALVSTSGAEVVHTHHMRSLPSRVAALTAR